MIDLPLDIDAVEEVLDEEFGAVDEFDLDLTAGGFSNETVYVDWGGRSLVLRCPPEEEPPDYVRLHDVVKEYDVLSALEDTEVPVPRALMVARDGSDSGVEFHVMEQVEGEVIRGLPGEEPERFAKPEHRQQLGYELVDTLAELHSLDVDDLDLGSWSDSTVTPESMVEDWRTQLERALDGRDRENQVLHEVADWLRDNAPAPAAENALLHGDYKLDNVMWRSGTPPELAAVFDWEMAAVGDPLVDLGWLLAFWWDGGEDQPALSELNPTFMTHDDYPTRRELVERYEEATGFELRSQRFYRTLAAFKLAVIAEEFHARFYLDAEDGDWFGMALGEKAPDLSQRALRLSGGGEPL